VGLVALTLLIWCTMHQRWTPEQWALPLDYNGDSLEILARVKAASEGELRPFAAHKISRLGAPFGADWSEYPGSDGWANFLLGQAARVIGVPAACNLALLLGHISAVLAFYFVRGCCATSGSGPRLVRCCSPFRILASTAGWHTCGWQSCGRSRWRW
jgi:hypothetical protein